MQQAEKSIICQERQERLCHSDIFQRWINAYKIWDQPLFNSLIASLTAKHCTDTYLTFLAPALLQGNTLPSGIQDLRLMLHLRKSWVKWVGKAKTYSMEGLLGHKSDFQLFMQNSNMTECVVIFYCAVYHYASGVNASCICSESLLLCVPSDSASCSIIIYSVRQQIRGFLQLLWGLWKCSRWMCWSKKQKKQQRNLWCCFTEGQFGDYMVGSLVCLILTWLKCSWEF